MLQHSVEELQHSRTGLLFILENAGEHNIMKRTQAHNRSALAHLNRLLIRALLVFTITKETGFLSSAPIILEEAGFSKGFPGGWKNKKIAGTHNVFHCKPRQFHLNLS